MVLLKSKCRITNDANHPIGVTIKPSEMSDLEMWKHLHRKLELEISNLWQRSIFLGTFIVLLLTGYGYYFGKVMIPAFTVQTNNGITLFGDLTGLFLAFLICIMGLLWVAMAKGSKYWYELYENKIIILENMIFHYKYKQFKYKEEYNIEKGIPLVCDKGLFSNDASCYSPSKINIVLGWILCFIGYILCVIHFVFLMFSQITCLCDNRFIRCFCCDSSCCIFGLLLALIVSVLVVLALVSMICDDFSFIRHKPVNYETSRNDCNENT